MRTALLSAIDRTPSGELRAGMTLGGRSVLAWQADFARALGCERIICLCEAPDEVVLDLQREFEGQGGEFHAIRSNLQLLSLVRAQDDLVMMRDGLVVDLALASDWLRENGNLEPGIAAIPASHVLVEAQGVDFERIDRHRHWAGLAICKAAQVHKLADFPPDGDAMSLLLRLALQAHVECRLLGDEALEQRRWLVPAADRDLAERERALIEVHAAKPSWSGFGASLSAAFVRRIAPKALASGAELSAGVSGIFLVAAAALATFGYGAAALGSGAAGYLALAFSGNFAKMRAALWSRTETRLFAEFKLYAGEAFAAGLLLYISWLSGASTTSLALPLLAIGISHTLGFHREGRSSAFWSDRFTHFAGFALAAGLGLLPEAIAIFALAGMADLLIRRTPAQNAV